MARGVNKVILIGNLGDDPSVRYMPSGGAVANMTVATSESWTDKQSGQKQERTEWTKVVMFNRLGEIAGEYLRKGSKVYIEGKLQTRKWQDNNGQDRYTTEVVANEMQMLDTRPAQGNTNSSHVTTTQQQGVASNGASASQYQNATGGNSQNTGGSMGNNYGDFDDDRIPF